MCLFLTTPFQPLKPNTDYSEHDKRLALALTESPWPTDQNRTIQEQTLRSSVIKTKDKDQKRQRHF